MRIVWWGQVQAGGLSGAKQLTWVFHRRAVDRRVPRFNQALYSCARYILLRCRRREKTVKPLAAVFRCNAIGQAKILFESHAHACLACPIGNKLKSTLLAGLRKPAERLDGVQMDFFAPKCWKLDHQGRKPWRPRLRAVAPMGITLLNSKPAGNLTPLPSSAWIVRDFAWSQSEACPDSPFQRCAL